MDLLKSLDPDAIKSKAEVLRPGYTCEVDIPLDGKALAGAYNVHVTITFDDDEEWLLRTPYQDGPSPSIEILKRIYESEAITLKVLDKIGVPVPRVYETGTGFLLKDKSKHCPCMKGTFADSNR
jgi:aminoglycoside phosphotransferase (APT) family kinase protein